MAGILDLLNSDLGKTLLVVFLVQQELIKTKTSSVLTMALPVLNESNGTQCLNTRRCSKVLMGALTANMMEVF